MSVYSKYTLPLIVVLLVSGCVNTKKKDDLSWLSKGYRNINSHFNGYFNAEELLTTSIESLEQQQVDNYSLQLPIYAYAAAGNPSAVAGDLDKAIEKVARVVALYPGSNWDDDCYLLLGKAQYLKKDFESAEATFRYMLNEFDPKEEEAKKKKKKDRSENLEELDSQELTRKEKEKLAKERKKEKKKEAKEADKLRKKYNRMIKKGKTPPPDFFKKDDTEDAPEKSKSNKINPTAEAEAPDEEKVLEAAPEVKDQEEDYPSYFMKHKPAHQMAQLWLARTLIERDKFDQAARLLQELTESEHTFPDVQRGLWPAWAYYYLIREENALAVESLNRAVELGNDRKNKARFSFLAAQLNQELGREAEALAAYENVLRFSNDYEMEFSAKMNMAQNEWLSGRATADAARAKLNKLLNDDKNEEFKDKIYYALAQIDLKAGDRFAAITNLKLSLANNIGNAFQQAESHFTLAQLYMKDENYVAAHAYADSSLQFMQSQDPRYETAERMRNSLKDIAETIAQIELKDSLLTLGAKSEAELRQLAYEIRKKEQEQELAAITASQSTRAASTVRPVNNSGPALQAPSDFFAYDDRGVRRGKREFLSKWGTRELTDNWRRSAANQIGDFTADVSNGSLSSESVTTAADALTEEDVKKILEGVPRSEAESRVLEIQLAELYFKLGSLYRDRLENNLKAIEALETLDTNFPRNNFELDSWYYLYLAHNEVGNRAQAQAYAEKIQRRYAGSDFAKIIQDPSYADKLMDMERAMNSYYQEAYQALQDGDAQRALQMAEQSQSKFGGQNALQPRFALLTALCVGKLEGEDAYKRTLNDVIGRYPNSDEARQAREILRLLGGGATGPTITENGALNNQDRFNLADNQTHYIILAFNQEVDLNAMKAKLSDFNQDYHQLARLRISNIFLGADPNNRQPLLIVRRFRNRDDAMNYYQSAEQNQSDFVPKSVDYDLFAVNTDNYRELLRSKTMAGYKEWFRSTYSGR